MRRNNAYDFFLLQVVSCSLQHSAAVRHLARRTTRDDMASSSYGARDWQKTSEPRVDFDRRVGKWRLRMNYTASSKKPTIIVRSSYVSTREEVEAMLPWWRLGWEQGNKGKKVNPLTQVNPPTPPDQQQSSDSPPTAEAMATTLPQGEFHSVPCVFSFHFVFNFNCAACCLRLLDVVPVVSRRLHRLARCLRAALHRYSSGAARIRLCCCYTAVLCT